MSDQATPETPATPEVNSTPDANASGDASPKAEKLFSQAELDAIVKERLSRAEAKAQAAEAKAKEQAAADALKEQGEYKTLSETQAKQLLNLTTERDALTTQLEAQTANAKKFEKALMGILEAQKAAVPEHVRPLLDKLPIDEQMAWIAANQGQIKVNGVPFTPKADAQGLTQQQREAVQRQVDRDYRRGF